MSNYCEDKDFRGSLSQSRCSHTQEADSQRVRSWKLRQSWLPPQESCPFPATLELPKPSSWQSRGPPALLQAFGLAKARLNRSWETGPSLVMLIVKNPPAKAGEQEVWVGSLAWEDPLEEEMAMHSSILAWRNPWTEEPGGPQSIGSHRVRYNWSHLADVRIRDLE